MARTVVIDRAWFSGMSAPQPGPSLGKVIGRFLRRLGRTTF